IATGNFLWSLAETARVLQAGSPAVRRTEEPAEGQAAEMRVPALAQAKRAEAAERPARPEWLAFAATAEPAKAWGTWSRSTWRAWFLRCRKFPAHGMAR